MNDWEELVPDLAESYGGQMPHPATNQEIAAAYLRAPKAVLREADRVAQEYQDGTARQPWGLLRHRAKNIHTDTANAETRVDRDKAIERAEQWIRTAGLMYDRPSEIEHELFGDTRTNPETDKDGEPIPASGQPPLAHYRDDTPLRNRILEHWADHRPAGQQVEQDAIDRGLRHQAERAALAPLRKAAIPPDNRPLEVRDGIRIP